MSVGQALLLLAVTVLVIVSTRFILRRVSVDRLGRQVTNRLRTDEAKQQKRSHEFEFAVRAIHSNDVNKLRAFDKHMSEHGLSVIGHAVDALRDSGYTNLSKRLTSAELDAIETLLHGSYAMGVPDDRQWDELLRHAVRNPLDAEAMVQVVQRGIFRIDQVIDMVGAFRDNPSPALSEGAL